ncbi:MAG: serine/threonine protein kinase [Acidobacteria bacterium]|nr:serine/threonine protein kinase [Acidobacteriota bacterium]
MSPERSQQIQDIFLAAQALAASEREGYLLKACAGDDELRREIVALLKFDEPAKGFLESSALEIQAQLLAERGQQLPAGHRLHHYEIISKIGDGGMGEVYLAKDNKLQREVALKILPTHLSQEPERVSRLEKEAIAASRLKQRNIPVIYEINEDVGVHYIAMELVEGQDLRKMLTKSPLSVNETVAICGQIARALQAAHAAGIVHRDIKPENIMLLPDGEVKVLDFGIAKLLQAPTDPQQSNAEGSRRTIPGLVLGTPGYMSPEQAGGRGIDIRTDIFSLGVLIYEMLIGQLPFSENNDTNLDSYALPRSLLNKGPGIPAELTQLVLTALQVEPDRRQQTISELLADLERVKAKLLSPVVMVGRGEEAPNPLLSEWNFSLRLRDWLKKNPNGGKLAILAASVALIAILLSRYVGAAAISVILKPHCEATPVELIFGYVIELNAGLFYLIGVPLVIVTGFQLLKFADSILRSLVSVGRLVINPLMPAHTHTHPFEVISQYNSRLFRITAPLFIIFALTEVGIPEYLGRHQVAFGWVQSLNIKNIQGATYSKLLADHRVGEIPQLKQIEQKYPGCEIRIDEVIGGHGIEDQDAWRTKFRLFLVIALGLQMAFICFALWLAAKIVFLFVLLIRLLLNRPNQQLLIKLKFDDKNHQFGLSGFSQLYNSFLAMILMIAIVFLLGIIANVPKGTSFFGGHAGWLLIGQGLLIGIGFLALTLITIGPVLIFTQLLTSAVRHKVDEIELEESRLEREIRSEKNSDKRSLLESEFSQLQRDKSLAQSQRPWPQKNSLYRRLLLASILLLFVLPIVIEHFGLLENGHPVSALILGLAKFLRSLC